MTLHPLSDQKIIDSWSKNGTPWTTAIREGRIESRKLVTDQAVIDAVLGRSPKTVFDIVCPCPEDGFVLSRPEREVRNAKPMERIKGVGSSRTHRARGRTHPASGLRHRLSTRKHHRR